MNYFVCDFETTTEPYFKKYGKTAMYLCDISQIGFEEHFLFLKMDDFLNYCFDNFKHSLFFFHSLIFDAEFIVYWLLENGYVYSSNLTHQKKCFKRLMTAENSIYYFKIKRGNKTITFRDSVKLIRGKVEQLGEMIGFPKGEIDYDKYEPQKSLECFDDKLINYLKRDVEIVKVYLKKYLEEFGEPKLTLASQSFNDFKNDYGVESFKEDFENNFSLEEWKYFQNFYYGGMVLFREKDSEKVIKTSQGIYADINSLYPSQMEKRKFPYGRPMNFKPSGESVCLYEIEIFEAKKKKGMEKMFNILYNLFHIVNVYDNRFVKEINFSQIHFYTDIDWANILKVYDIKYQILKTTWFKVKSGIFTNWVQKWIIKKENAKNEIERKFYKEILNSLYGKFGTNIYRKNKEVCGIGKNGVYEEKIREDVCYTKYYLPLAIWTTSYARDELLGYLLKDNNYKWVVYCDTDSIISRKPLNIPISQKLGEFKIERLWREFKVLRAKCYLLIDDLNKPHIVASGLQKRLFKSLKASEIYRGKEFINLRKKKVNGGYLLLEQKWRI